MPAWTGRFAVAVLAGAGAVSALCVAVFGSTVPQAGVIAALYLGVGGGVGVLMRASYPHAAIGLCNLVTLARLALTLSLLAPLAGSGAGLPWAVFTLALIALALDGLDGWLARWQRLATAFGARFDMEVDAGLSLILALNAFGAGHAGAVVLLLALPRYAFVAAGRIMPWLARPLPERLGRKIACVMQIGALIALQAPILPAALASVVVAAAALGLGWSFGRDVLWLYRRRA